MRSYGKVGPKFWIDFTGQQWPEIQSTRRLKFQYPAHAALRRHFFNRDGYQCVRCDARASAVPPDFDGTETLTTDTTLSSGYPDVLVLDHVITLRAGGRSVVENLQTLCQTCNKRKQREDRAAVLRYQREAA